MHVQAGLLVKKKQDICPKYVWGFSVNFVLCALVCFFDLGFAVFAGCDPLRPYATRKDPIRPSATPADFSRL